MVDHSRTSEIVNGSIGAAGKPTDEKSRNSDGESQAVAPNAGGSSRVDRGDEPVRQSGGVARVAGAGEGLDVGRSMDAWLCRGASSERHRHRELWLQGWVRW